MPLPLLIALGVAAIPVGAVAIAKATKQKTIDDLYDDGLIVTIHPTQRQPDLLKALMMGTALYLVAKKVKVI